MGVAGAARGQAAAAAAAMDRVAVAMGAARTMAAWEEAVAEEAKEGAAAVATAGMGLVAAAMGAEREAAT